jgi:hypothetical protein
MFSAQASPTKQRHNWNPPTELSPMRIAEQLAIPEITMADATPPRPDVLTDVGEESTTDAAGRLVSNNAAKRVLKSRRRRATFPARRRRGGGEDGSESEDEDDEEDGMPRVTRNTSHNTTHHYTVNVPSAPTQSSPLPVVLLG